MRNGLAEPVVPLADEHQLSVAAMNTGSFGFRNDDALMDSVEDLDEIQPHTKCNSCWGRCMPRRCCQCWFDMWPCCRPVGMRVPREDPLNPKTNLRLLFFTLLGIVCGLIGGFVVRIAWPLGWNWGGSKVV